MHEPSLAQQILICCDKILFSHTQRGYQFLFLDYFIIFRVFFVILRSLIFTKIIYYYYFIIFLFMKIIFIFSCSGMFREVPECSGMFRDVPCFWFYRSPAPGDTVLLYLLNQGSVDVSCLSLFPTIFKISREHILN